MWQHRLKVAYYDAKCQGLYWYRSWQNAWSQRVKPTYLFLLTAPYVGSTLLHEIISRSPQVTANNIFGTREGVGLPQVRSHLDYQREWDPMYAVDWPTIKTVWERYWAHQYPIRLDKSPLMLLRAAAVEQVFQPSYFVVLVRHPYAHCASLKRRNKLTIQQAAAWCKQTLRAQYRNCRTLPRVHLVRYEDLTNAPHTVIKQLLDFMPELASLRIDGYFKAHNQQQKALPIQNMNAQNVQQLTPKDIQEIHRIFEDAERELAFFQYPLQ